jgi:hypothetical protein
MVVDPKVAATIQNSRKPLAYVVTAWVVKYFMLVVENAPTRVSKPVPGKGGLQETGEFAKFLDEIFAIFNIKASGAGQAKIYLQHARTLRTAFHLPRSLAE